jgi:predicted nucleic-acid-binding protein
VIAFDTNVLVRLLVRDDAEQFAAATALLEAAGEDGETCYLADAVLCETEWVLTSRYSARRADVLAALTEIAADGRYAFDDPDAVAEALRAYAAGRADFSDYLIGARSRAKGARTTYTFDGKLKNREGFTYLR